MIARFFPFMLIAGLILCAWPVSALAHANLSSSTPAADAVVSEPPETVTLWFTGRIEPDFSTIEVTDSDGRQVDKGDSSVSSNRRSIEVGLDPLEPGEYHVEWTVVARDGHRMRGDFSFTVE